MGVCNRILPRHTVAVKAKTLMPVGTAINIVEAIKNIRIQLGTALVNI